MSNLSTSKRLPLFIVAALGLSFAGCKEEASWKAEGTTEVAGANEVVVAWVQNLGKWPYWKLFNDGEHYAGSSPSFAGASTGIGAKLSWMRDGKPVGASLEVVEAEGDAAVTYRTTTRADAPNGKGSIRVTGEGNRSTVVWVDSGALKAAGAAQTAGEIKVGREWMIKSSLDNLKREVEAALASEAKLAARKKAEAEAEVQRKKEEQEKLTMPKEGAGDGD